MDQSGRRPRVRAAAAPSPAYPGRAASHRWGKQPWSRCRHRRTLTSSPSVIHIRAQGGEAFRRIREAGEGAAMIRTEGEAGTGNVMEAIRHVGSVMGSVQTKLHDLVMQLGCEGLFVGSGIFKSDDPAPAPSSRP